MSEIILLFLLGIALLAADAFVSSFILAICGFVAMLGGCALAYRGYGALAAGLAGVAAGGPSRDSRSISSWSSCRAPVTFPRPDRAFHLRPAGAAARLRPTCWASPAQALTTLAPSGYVEVEGRRVEAFSQSGLIAKGEQVTIFGVDNFRLIVSKSP